jgi:class 3 adenylate cyclase/tetratricopeptide (TPR) repeat protein
MEYRVLGVLEVLDASGQPLALGGTRQQTVLGSLLLRAGETVPLERLVDELWERPPDTAAKTVQVYVSRLRRLLSPGAIESRSGGYALRLDGDQLDLTQFEQLADEGRTALSAAEWERAASLLGDALALWRGPALGGLSADALRREAERLEEARLQVLEDRVEADLARGREREVVPELRALVAEHPFRERLCGQLMRGLYAAGRQAEALEVYRETRTLLDEELGLEPGAELRELERRMLSHDPALEAVAATAPPRATAPLEAVEHESIRARRPATVVFADVVESTALGEQLDPESVHRILERYSETATTILERHGGTVEKFIGDAIVGFFGLTEVHEDDAQRAVRAAIELRSAVAELCEELRRTHGIELGVKIGVNSGDVFVGAGSRREMFATGDSVNVAARLEQHGNEGEILLGERTFRLVEDIVDAEPLEPFAVKGRKALVSAWLLLDLSSAEPLSHRHQVPFVGRELQLQELRNALARVRDERSCLLCTIVGPAGMGKSRLAEEFVNKLDGSATVAVGRCLSYGEAITYHALAEILQELVGREPDRRIEELVGDDAELVGRRVRATMGLDRDTAPAEETFWAIRRLFESAAAERPLIAIVDDLHWGEPLLLDLLEYLAGFSAGAPILILCLARRELFEARPSWAAGEVVALEALAEPDARELVQAIGEGEIEPPEEARIVRTGEGNPLFLEQLVATRTECGAEHLPPNVQAVLTARVASLDPGERKVLEHASVEGRNFRWNIVADLLPEEARESLGRDLMALVRRQLIEPDPSVFAGEDGFRFSHVLIREAVYEGLPKEVCADLHERLADRLRGRGEAEVVGHHLEQAFRARSQLGLVGDREWELARQAQACLQAAAQKVLLGGDPDAAADLLARAVSLLPQDDTSRVGLLPRLGVALFEAGRFTEADEILTEAIDRAGGDDLLEARARLEQQFVRLQAEGAIDEPDQVAQETLRVFEAHGDLRGQSRTWCLRATVDWIQGQVEKADEGWLRAADLARLADDELELFEILAWRASAAPIGPTPVPDAIATCAEIREEVEGSPLAKAQILPPFASLYAMQGDFETARSLVQEANTLLGELGRIYTVALAHHDATVELLAGEPAAAEERLRTAYERLDELGEKAFAATTAAMLAHAVYAQGRYEEASQFCRASREAAAADDLSAQVEWRSVSAKLIAQRGRYDEAETLAREAVELVAQTDCLRFHGEALLDLGDVLALSGEPQQAAEAFRTGLELYEQKGDTVMAGRARSRLDATDSA